MALRTKEFKGIRFSFVNWRELALIYKDIFIGKEYKFTADTDSPLILDCGAHIGVSVLYFKKLYPKAKIIAFEPNPKTFKLLELNIEQNNLKDVELVNAAVAKRQGKIDFFVSKKIKSPWTWGDAGVKNKWYNPRDCKIIMVPAVKLSSYIKDEVGLIKLDVEGMEEEVLREIEGNLNLVEEIIIEFHGSSTNKANSAERIFSIFDRNALDYTIKQKGKIIKAEQIKKTDPYWLMIHVKRSRVA